MLNGSIAVLPFQEPSGSNGSCSDSSTPSDVPYHHYSHRIRRCPLSGYQVFPLNIRSLLYWFFYPLLIDFSCPPCYVITRNPQNNPALEYPKDIY